MVYKCPIYVPLIAALIAVVAGGVGIVLVRRRSSPGPLVVAFAISVLSGGIFAPMLAMDTVVLDDEKLEQTTGFWFAPTVKGFRLADVSSVSISTALDRKGREYEAWVIQMKNGQSQTIDPGDLWEVNGPDIISRLRQRGVQVVE